MVDDQIGAARRNGLPWCDATDCSGDQCQTQDAPVRRQRLMWSAK